MAIASRTPFLKAYLYRVTVNDVFVPTTTAQIVHRGEGIADAVLARGVPADENAALDFGDLAGDVIVEALDHDNAPVRRWTVLGAKLHEHIPCFFDSSEATYALETVVLRGTIG